MPTVYTIGYQGKSLAKFIGRLRESGVTAVIDVRLRNTSQLAGYTKRDDLAFLLTRGFGIAYEHRLELAPTAEILDERRAGGTWEEYVLRFRPQLEERGALAVGREVLARYLAPCLLCTEASAQECHRSLVADYWAEGIPDLAVVHL